RSSDLVLGKSIGISLMVLLAKKIKLISIPSDISTSRIIGVSFLAGIGFTMAIFISTLAFADNPSYIDSAKIGVLIGSVISAAIGYLILLLKDKNERHVSLIHRSPSGYPHHDPRKN